jgi:hypothetical protein
LVEAAIESAEIPLVEPEITEAEPETEPEIETEPQPERVLETAVVGYGVSAEAEPEPPQDARRMPPSPPEGVDIHAVTEKPSSPRRGWWTRLIQ